MTCRWRVSARALLPALLLAAPPLVAACGAERPQAQDAAAAESSSWRYRRGFVFVGERGGQPLVVPFTFEALPRDSGLRRDTRASLAHGETWDAFFAESWTGGAGAGPWKVLPHGPLRLAAAGPLEVESLWYQQRGRSLRLALLPPRSPWQGDQRARARLRGGRLTVGAERSAGVVLEEYEVTAVGGDSTRGPRDQLVLTAGDSVLLFADRSLAADGTGARGHAWLRRGAEARTSEDPQMEWLELRALERARRDVPVRWRFRLAGGEWGEVQAVGYETEVGDERAGRRGVEVRYTVEGWLEVGEERIPVSGYARHRQG